MSSPVEIYTGPVVHKRLRPKPHALRYRVFSLLVDLDRLSDAERISRFFSVNRWNALSFHEADHGEGTYSGLAAHIRSVMGRAGIDTGPDARLLALSYPRIFGYVFNPLTVYFLLDREDRLLGLVYEVNNTWGERHSYVVPAGPEHAGVYAQRAEKRMFVSPFAAEKGRYGFRVTAPGSRVAVGVSLFDADGALIKTHFTGEREAASSFRLAMLLLRFPLMTLKVMGAIHIEALKLWLKGVPVVRGSSARRYTISLIPSDGAKVTDAA
ncbi:MAG: DUF1365 domain-containing protein [Hyphomicrobium sp.]|nr:DUF1365 domain-containing protein [Hyphomicrobium sp.]